MILHVDMDAFYAAVEQRDRPALRGKPVVVGGDAAGRGVVSAASYEARSYGIHSAMPSSQAKRLCPHAVFLSPRMNHYAAVSKQIRELFFRYTPLVEPLSLDEAFLDVAGSRRLFGTAERIGLRIQQEIETELGLVASVGVAPNKFLAKLASDLEKPRGFVVVDSGRIEEFLDPLPIGRIWGVGRVTGKAFDRLGIRNVGQLKRLSEKILAEQFGEQGKRLWQLARGIDNRDVVPDRAAKSISHETTFATDISDNEVLGAWILELAEQVGRRLRRNKLRGRTIHLKVRFCDFRTVNRAMTLENPTDVTQEVYMAAARLLGRLPSDHLPVRLLGVGLSGFDSGSGRQQLLFDEQSAHRQKRVDVTSDEIREKFGHAALARGSRLMHKTQGRSNAAPAQESDTQRDSHQATDESSC